MTKTSPDATAPPAPPATAADASLVSIVRWTGVVAVLVGMFLHAMAITEPLPWWDLDPTRMTATVAGLTPAGSMLVDALILLGAALALLGERLARRAIAPLPVVLFALGSAGVLVHAFGGGGALEHLRLGSAWIAAMGAGLAVHHLARDQRAARFIAAVVVGFIAVLAAKGALEIFVEHPNTLADFRANREAFLAAQGWTPDSVMAKSFERRLVQPEASGWFGLANVYATFAAGGAVALAGLTLLAWLLTRRPAQLLPDGMAGIVTLGLLAAGACVWMAGSKAGLAVTLLGVGFWGAALAASRLAGSRGTGLLAPAAALAAVALPIGAVVARGFVGSRLGELSLLFRAFYLQGAVRVFADHPLIGVGPAGFKDAYLLAKNPLSPEEVTSAHNIVADFTATLGVFGVAWVALVLLWVWRAGGTLASRSPLERAYSEREAVASSRAAECGRVEHRLIIAVAAAAVLVSAWLQLAEATPESALMRVAALLGWIVLAVGLLAVARLAPGWRSVFAASSLAVAAHLQLDVTPVWSASASLAMVWLASAGCAPAREEPRRSWRAGMGFAAPLLLTLLAVALVIGGVRPALRWESHLRTAAEAVAPLPELSARLNALRDPSALPLLPGDSLPRLHADIALALGTPSRTGSPDADLAILFLRRAEAAGRELAAAAEVFPSHAPTLQAAGRLAMNAAGAADALGDPSASHWAEQAEALALRATGTEVGTAAAWGWLGVVRSTRAAMTGRTEDLRGAVEAWEEAMRLDPHSPSVPRQLVDALVALGEREKARAWAARLLEIDEQGRLDPLRRLPPEERARLERLAAGS